MGGSSELLLTDLPPQILTLKAMKAKRSRTSPPPTAIPAIISGLIVKLGFSKDSEGSVVSSDLIFLHLPFKSQMYPSSH